MICIPLRGASPNYFGKDNVILTLGGGFRLVTFSDVLTTVPGLPHINDVMRLGVIMKRHNDVIFSKIVWRRPLSERIRR